MQNVPAPEMTPLLSDRGRAFLMRVRTHPQAPIWNFACSDRLNTSDLAALRDWKKALSENRASPSQVPPDAVLAALMATRAASPLLQQRIPTGFHLKRDWVELPTMDRAWLADHLPHWVPQDVSLDEMVIYATSGTTGHPLVIPKTPFAVGCYQVAIDWIMAQYGVRVDFQPEMVANFLVCDQHETVMYASSMRYWAEAVHAKINLNPRAWRKPNDLAAFWQDFQPPILTVDPMAFARLLTLPFPIHPKILISTASYLDTGLRTRLEDRFAVPVVDWYGSNEAGPVAYACPHGNGWVQLPHDLWIEVLDENGLEVPNGHWGELTLSGGSNPYLPLLRYRTGDFALRRTEPCSCGDPMPHWMAIQGRRLVRLIRTDGKALNQADVSKLLRPFPIRCFTFVQHPSGACTLHYASFAGTPLPDETTLVSALSALLGGFSVTLSHTYDWGKTGKTEPFVSHFGE